jgi:hypothetical protein
MHPDNKPVDGALLLDERVVDVFDVNPVIVIVAG